MDTRLRYIHMNGHAPKARNPCIPEIGESDVLEEIELALDCRRL